MFSRILVPLDGSPESNVALPVARTVADATGASITLLRVLPSSTLPGDRLLASEATQALDRIVRELQGGDLKVDAHVCYGEAADEILNQLHAQSADLIVMRTHGRAGLERALLGSVAERVLTAGVVPAVFVRPGGRRISHIQTLLVPVDGSPGGAVALGIAVGLARATGATIKLLEIAVPIPLDAWAGYAGMSYYDPAWDEEALASAQTYAQGLVTRLRASGLSADGEARMKPGVAETIVAVAEEVRADLIVMSTEALTGVARFLLGSVADAVVRTAHCPVLLLHRPEAAKAADVQGDATLVETATS
jgi:nucleotide-binding universal stress UspA family protein